MPVISMMSYEERKTLNLGISTTKTILEMLAGWWLRVEAMAAT